MTTESQSQEPVKTVVLKHPYEFGEKQINECIFTRRPKAKDLKGLKLNELEAEGQCILLGRVTNLTTPEIEEMDLADFQTVGEALASFLPNTPKVGRGI